MKKLTLLAALVMLVFATMLSAQTGGYNCTSPYLACPFGANVGCNLTFPPGNPWLPPGTYFCRNTGGGTCGTCIQGPYQVCPIQNSCPCTIGPQVWSCSCAGTGGVVNGC